MYRYIYGAKMPGQIAVRAKYRKGVTFVGELADLSKSTLYLTTNKGAAKQFVGQRKEAELVEYVLVPKEEYERAKAVLASDSLKGVTRVAGLNNFIGVE
jgi:hypothetical protein